MPGNDEEREARRALRDVAHQDGFTVDEMLEAAASAGSVPAVCVAPGCRYRDELEPDFEDACPECGGRMASVLVLAGVI